ncbi:hypothetical protein TcasGA2_TC032432 [Tribolium castaneum]|uniref:Krueppel-like factor 7 n=1 Tax=Tribolium castaneum TaxID=7070 RepID=A0A139WLM7_TRICA|nr:hypothetical protein TcasGA2_TC032432 [Tribolium castaneum]
MDILPSVGIFRELQDIHDTGYFSAQPSLDDHWQQVIYGSPPRGAPPQASTVQVLHYAKNVLKIDTGVKQGGGKVKSLCTERLRNPITTPHVSRAFINAIPVTQCPILDIPRRNDGALQTDTGMARRPRNVQGGLFAPRDHRTAADDI